MRRRALLFAFVVCALLCSTSTSTSTSATATTTTQFRLRSSSSNGEGDDTYMIPAAIKSGAWQLWIVSVLYLCVSAGALIGFAQAAFRLKGTYYRAAFLGVSFVFCALRCVLTMVYFHNWAGHLFWLYLLNFFLPVYLQYYTFSLLILFVVRCLFIMHNDETRLRRYVYPAYHCLQLGLFVVCIIASVVLADSFDPDQEDTWDKQPSIYVAVLYALLTLCGIYYSTKAYQILSPSAVKSVMMGAGSSSSSSNNNNIVGASSVGGGGSNSSGVVVVVGASAGGGGVVGGGGYSGGAYSGGSLRRFVFLIPLFIVIFFLRTVWDVLYYAGVNPVMATVGSFIKNDDAKSFDYAFLIFYSIFEIIPQALVVYIFAFKLGYRQDASGGLGGAGGAGVGASLLHHHSGRHVKRSSSSDGNSPPSSGPVYFESPPNDSSQLYTGADDDYIQEDYRWNVDALEPLAG